MATTPISRGNQYPKREARDAQFDEIGFQQVQRDIDKLFRAFGGMKNGLTLGGVTVTGITTSIGAPGSDAQIPTEQAVREAIDANGWQMLWAFFLGAA